MRSIFLGLFFALVCSAAMAFSFPPLSGRVVDAAHILSDSTVQSLDQMLADFERQSSDQLVVATIPSLEGGTIEDYGYQLGRNWGLGQKDKNNGVLLVVAPHEHKVRIEVGYGLEDPLTDTASNIIIQNVILPEFRQGRMEQGIVKGTQAIIAVLGGTPLADAAPNIAPASKTLQPFIFIGLLILWMVFMGLRLYWVPLWFPHFFGQSRSGSGLFFDGGFGSGFGSGGFSGGGGSFGGGGASGGW